MPSRGLRLYYKNNALIDVSSWIDCTARASNGATDNDLIFPQAFASLESGIEFDTTTSLILDSLIRSTAGPESTACVAQAVTLQPPYSSNASAPFTSVPAVSMMSSTIKQFWPCTSPI